MPSLPLLKEGLPWEVACNPLLPPLNFTSSSSSLLASHLLMVVSYPLLPSLAPTPSHPSSSSSNQEALAPPHPSTLALPPLPLPPPPPPPRSRMPSNPPLSLPLGTKGG